MGQFEHEFPEGRRHDGRESAKESADVGGGARSGRHAQCKPAENSELREIEKH